jgi:hypothetical protein
MEINEARQIVRNFCSKWTTQKLCEVLAFAEDGKMQYLQPCGCLLGVASSDVLHESVEYCADKSGDTQGTKHLSHYLRIKSGSSEAGLAEIAYRQLGHPGLEYYGQDARDAEFIAILNSILSEREMDSSKEPQNSSEMSECESSVI